MKLLSVKQNGFSTDIRIENIKYLIGNNYSKIYQLFNVLINLSNNLPDSEYFVENKQSQYAFIDEMKLTTKNFLLFKVFPYCSLSEDLKLGTKSIVTKLLEYKLSDFEYMDSIHTVNILLDSLSSEVNENDELLKIKFKDLNQKQLVKLIDANIEIEEMALNEKDLSYEQIIEVQLKLIKQLCDYVNQERVIVLVNAPKLTNNLLRKELYSTKATYLVHTSWMQEVPNIEQIMIFDEQMVDLADDDQIYEVYCNNKYFDSNIEEAKVRIIRELQKYFDVINSSVINF